MIDRYTSSSIVMMTRNVTPSMILSAAVAGDLLVGGQGGGPGDVYLEARRRGQPRDQLLDGFHRFVGQRLTHVAGQMHLHIGGFTVVALGAGLGQRVAPEILDMLDVLLVGLEPVDHVVVEPVGFVAEFVVPLGLQHDHRRAVGVELVEHLCRRASSRSPMVPLRGSSTPSASGRPPRAGGTVALRYASSAIQPTITGMASRPDPSSNPRVGGSGIGHQEPLVVGGVSTMRRWGIVRRLTLLRGVAVPCLTRPGAATAREQCPSRHYTPTGSMSSTRPQPPTVLRRAAPGAWCGGGEPCCGG